MPDMEAVIPFKYADATVRTSEQDGAVWFSLQDVCAVLGHTTPTRAASRLDADEVAQMRVPTSGGMQTMTMVSESGMYSLVLTSRVQGAKEFKSWITREVLPSIRNTGQYLTPEKRESYGRQATTLANIIRPLRATAPVQYAAIRDTVLYGWLEYLADPASLRRLHEIAPPNE